MSLPGPGATSAAHVQSGATTGNGSTVDFGQAVGALTWAVVVTGTVTAGAISLEVSLDGTNFFALPTAALTNLSAATLANPYVLVTGTNALFGTGAATVAARYARARISTAITGGAVADVWISGY